MSFIKTSESQAAEDLMKTYGKFLRNFKESLNKIGVEEKSSSQNLFLLKHDSSPDNVSVFQLLESDNKLLTKVLIVFFHLNKEAKKLIQNGAPIIKKLTLIEDEIVSAMEANDGLNGDPIEHAIIKFSYSLEELMNMKFLIQNSIYLSANVIQQYCALFSMEKFLHIIPSTQFPSNLDDVALLFKNIMIFDTIFRSGIYKSYLELYGEMLIENEQKFGANEDAYRNLQSTLHELDLLLDGKIFELALDNIIATKRRIKTKSLAMLENLILTYIKNLISSINVLDAGNNISELSDTDDIIKLNIMTVIYQKLFENLDPKNLRFIIEVNNKYPAMILHGNFIYNGNEFLKRFLNSLEKSNIDVEKIQQNFLSQKIHALNRDSTQYSNQLLNWILQMQSQAQLGNENQSEKMLQARCELFYEGLTIAGEMSFLIKTVINLHAKFNQLLSKSLASSIYKLIENLRVIKSTYIEHATFISDSIAFVFRYLQFHALNIIGLCQKKVMMDVKKEKKFDLSTTLVLITKLLYSNVSESNLNAITLALNLTEPFKNFGNEYSQRLLKLLDHMMILCRLKENVEKVTDPSFLFWHQNLIGPYFKQQLQNSLDQRKTKLFMEMGSECMNEENLKMLENVQNFHPLLENAFHEVVIKKLCNTIEINLRLDFHSNLQVEKFNCFDTSNDKIAIEDNRTLVKLPHFVVNKNYISVQNEVEFYLSKMFYNLTTISLKDWQSYEQMRQLAEKKYEIETVDDHLPTQTLEQGIDVLQIMRNIHLFVSHFYYNLNNQIFVEGTTSPNQTHYNTIGIHNIANSLATHGFGIVNTTINFVYQFLRKKFVIFSQLIYDERIKSRLAKEMKIWRESVETNEKRIEIYNFDRAHRLNREIKKLDLLDKIRVALTEIGNTMAYVRMIKSGICHVNSNSISYIPFDDDETSEFVGMCEGLSKETISAGKFLQKDIDQAMKKMQEGFSYFKKLSSIFSTYFQSSKNSHMKNFYIFIPALTINYIENISIAKDRLNKKNKEESLFTDDGFAIGIVFMLTLLNQFTEFNSLNWFESVKNKIKLEKEKIQKQRIELEKTKGDNLLQTLLLSEKRILEFEMEFKLLFFSINSCKIFFQN